MEYKIEKFKLRQNNPPEVFKSIRFQNDFPDRFTGHLNYLRIYYDGYDYLKGDILDDKILKTLQSRFENSNFIYNELLLLDKQLLDCLTWTKGGDEKDIIFYFYPQTDYETYQKLSDNNNLKSYFLALKAKFIFKKGDSKIDLIPKEMIVHVPIEELDKLIKTIKSV